MFQRSYIVLIFAVAVGCGTSRGVRVTDSSPTNSPAPQHSNATNEIVSGEDAQPNMTEADSREDIPFLLAAHQTIESTELQDEPVAITEIVEETLPPVSAEIESVANLNEQQPPAIDLDTVIASVHRAYPLVQAAFLERQIANGNQIAAWGEFDTKLKAASENGPLGFYETYRNDAGFITPLYGGGEVFGGYRNGGGNFQPWYQERETNDGGEFKAGVRVPLIRDRDIDGRRAQLWRATYDQQLANPFIRASLVQFSREASLAYWKWVAAGQKYQLGLQWVDLAAGRNDQIKRRVELEDLDPPELIDNERAIAKRQAKLADSLRELQQAALKLSIFLRDENGAAFVPDLSDLPDFPELRNVSADFLTGDISRAIQNRPELQALDLEIQRLRVDFAEASNMTRAALDAQLVGSQDVGEPTSSKRDKSQFELEAALFFDVPLQRRKGRGKMQAVQGKMAQVAAKRRLVEDKVAAEVRAAYTGLIQARLEALQARQAVDLASQMADIERIKFEVGESDLLKVALREQYALEAAEEEVSATYNHFVALTEYAAALAIDRPSENLLPPDDTQ